MSAFSPFHWITLFWLFGGAGIPLAMPPMPEDPMMARVAPEECLFYMTAAGVASPEPSSANQTEQLLAEPEVQAMVASIEHAIREGMSRSGGRGLPPGVTSEGLVDMMKMILSRPLAVYVSSVQMQPSGPMVHGGFVVNCGDGVAKVKALIDALVANLPGSSTSGFLTVTGGQIVTQTLGMTVAWEFKDKCLYVGVGKGECEALLKRIGGEPPKWLATLRKQLPVERTSTVTYFNVKAIKGIALPLAGVQAEKAVEALGFDNVDSLFSVTGLDETGCVNKTLLSIEGEPGGILRLANVEPLALKDLGIVPQDATLAVAFKLNPNDAYNTILEILGKVDPPGKERLVHGLERMGKELDLNVQEDFLKSVGDTWRLFDSPSEGGLLTGLTLVAPLRDAKQATEVEAKLVKLFESIQSSGPSENAVRRLPGPNVEKLDFGGRRIYSFVVGNRKFLVTPSWCLTDKELIVTLYPQNVKAYLSRSAEFKSLDQVPEVAKAFEGDVGPFKMAYCDTRRAFDLLYPFVTVFSQAMAREVQRNGVDIGAALLPSARAIRGHLSPTVMSVRRTKAGIEILERHSLPVGGTASVSPIGVSILLPAVQASRASAQRMMSLNSMRQIGLAMHNYAQANKSFPPAYTADAEGKPLLSWRVLILPYLEQDGLYKQFHLDEPWDSEHNKKLVAQMPAVYKSPSSRVAGGGKTNYLTIRGEGTIFPGNKGVGFGEIVDGMSNTILTVEASDEKAVVWTKPDDFEFDADNPLKGLAGLQPGGFNVGMADGSVRFLPASLDPKTARLLFLRNDREPLDWGKVQSQ